LNQNNKSAMKKAINILAVLIFASCQKQYFPPAPAVTITGPVSFSEVIQPILTASCAVGGCHNGTQAPNLSSGQAWGNLVPGGLVDTIAPAQSIVYQRLKGTLTPAMPPTGSLPPTDIAEVLAWIKQGAQNN
jgi:hypothetical protein